MTAAKFISTIKEFSNERDQEKVMRSFKGNDKSTRSLGLAFRTVFAIAKQFSGMELAEVEKLLESKYYEVRMGAASIMDFKARNKKTTAPERKALFNLFLDQHDRLNNWDFADRAAPSVIGEYLLDKDRRILYKLAKSKDPWRRRTAIVSTYAFIKRNQLDDTFALAELLLLDKEDLVNKAVGSWLREAGKKDQSRLRQFLNKYAATMPRSTLRYAIEKLDKADRTHYMNLE
jgi:3-methyladenine DNA glycosylase AlkD